VRRVKRNNESAGNDPVARLPGIISKKEETEMRRTKWAALVVFLGLALPAWGAHVSMPETNATAGETVEVPVMVDNASGIAGFQFMITYDVKMLQASGAGPGDLTGGWMVKANTAHKGEVTVAGVDTSLACLGAARGSLAKLRFTVVAKKDGASSLTFGICKLSDNAGAKIASVCDQGSIAVRGASKPKPRPSK
jgi:Cohesin domain